MMAKKIDCPGEELIVVTRAGFRQQMNIRLSFAGRMDKEEDTHGI